MINFENENVVGSITLKGALIDDITFKKYNETLGSDKKVTYLNPEETNDGYFIETGWAASNLGKVSLPNAETIWNIKGNKKLTEGNPITLEWNNNSGLIFHKHLGTGSGSGFSLWPDFSTYAILTVWSSEKFYSDFINNNNWLKKYTAKSSSTRTLICLLYTSDAADE